MDRSSDRGGMERVIMIIEQVIEIAKTLYCDFEGTGYCGGTYFIHYEHEMYYGDTPEEALRSAGWKG